MATELELQLKLPVQIVLGSVTTFTSWRAICYLEGESSLHTAAAGRAGKQRSEVARPSPPRTGHYLEIMELE